MICPRCGGPGWLTERAEYSIKCIVCNGHGELSVEEYDSILKAIDEGRKQSKKRATK